MTKEKMAPYKLFGKEIMMPIVTYTNEKKDEPPKMSWDDEIFIDRAEDWYSLMYYAREKKTVRVITRNEYIFWSNWSNKNASKDNT